MKNFKFILLVSTITFTHLSYAVGPPKFGEQASGVAGSIGETDFTAPSPDPVANSIDEADLDEPNSEDEIDKVATDKQIDRLKAAFSKIRTRICKDKKFLIKIAAYTAAALGAAYGLKWACWRLLLRAIR